MLRLNWLIGLDSNQHTSD